MIMDNKGRLFGKISIVDVVIIFVVVAAIAGIGYKFSKSKMLNPFSQGDTVQIQFFWEETPEYAVESIKVGDTARDPSRNAVFGTVKEVKKGPSISWGVDSQGRQVKSSKEGYNSVLVTVEGKGIYSSNGVSFDGSEYAVGKTLEVRAGNGTFWCRISGISKKE